MNAAPARKRRILSSIVGVVALVGVLGLAPAKAEAYPWSPNVAVSVRAKCNSGSAATIRLSGPALRTWTYSWNYSGAYQAFTLPLRNVPAGSGTYVDYELQCRNRLGITARASGRWGIARPAVGGSVNKVVCAYWPSGACYF